VYAIQLTFFACTRFCVLGAISRVRNRTSLLTQHAVSGQERSFACTQCCRWGLHARETIPGLAFRVYVMLRLFFAYMRFYTYTDISRVRNSLSLYCMHAVLYQESLFACLQYILAASGAREHVSKPRFRVYAMLPPVFAYTRNYSRAGIPRVRKSSCPPSCTRATASEQGVRVYANLHGHILYTRTFPQELIPRIHKAQPQTANKNHIYNMSKKIDLLQKFEKKNRKIWIF